MRVPLISTERDAIIARLKQHGFFFEDIWYDKPVSPARLYGSVQFNEAAYPNAVIAAGSVYNVPTHQFCDSPARTANRGKYYGQRGR